MKSFFSRWLWVVLYLLALYLLLPLASPAISWAQAHRLTGLIRYGSPLLLVAAGLWLALHMAKRGNPRLGRNLVVLGGVGCLYFIMMVYLVQVPVERFHAILFAGLTVLVYQNYRKTSAGFRSYAYTAAFVTCVSFSDEFAQGFMQSRLYDNRDILLNVGSAALILLLFRMFSGPSDERPSRGYGLKDYTTMAGILLITAAMFLLRRTPLDAHRIVGKWVAREGCGNYETMAFTEKGEVLWTDDLGNESKGRYTVKGNPFGENVFSVEATEANNASECGWQKEWKGSNLIFFEEESFRLLNHPTSWIRRER